MDRVTQPSYTLGLELICDGNLRPRWLAQRNRDLWEKFESEPALVTEDTISTEVEKQLFNLNEHVQSNWNHVLSILIFDFTQGISIQSLLADNAWYLGMRLLQRKILFIA